MIVYDAYPGTGWKRYIHVRVLYSRSGIGLLVVRKKTNTAVESLPHMAEKGFMQMPGSLIYVNEDLITTAEMYSGTPNMKLYVLNLQEQLRQGGK